MIIGVTGTIGAGKGLFVEYLKTKDFSHFSARNFLTRELEKRGSVVDRPNMVNLANEIREKNGGGAMISLLIAEAKKNAGNSVIESIRTLGEVETFRKEPASVLVAIDADPVIRFQRVLKRGSATDHVSYEKFLADDEKEMHSPEAWKGNLRGCIRLADFLIENNGTKEEFFQKAEKILQECLKRQIVVGGRYQHFKNKKIYRVLGIAKHSETLEDLVVYEAQYENELSKLWVRPLSLFTGVAEYEGKKVLRFKLLEE